MADQLAIFLQSRFDARGVSSAEKELDKLNKKVSELKSKGRLFELKPEEFLGRSQQSLKVLDAEIKALREVESLNKRAAMGAKRLGNELGSKIFTQRAQMMGREVKAAESLLTAEDRLKLALDRGSGSRERNISLIQSRISTLQKEAKLLREAAQAEAARGTKAGQANAQSLMQQSAAQDRAAQSLKKLTDQRFIDTGITEKQAAANKAQSTLMGVLASKFNQIGFTMFVTASTARMFFQIFESGFDMLSEGAAVLDRQRAFTQILSGEGIDTETLRSKLREASEGLVPLDLALQKSLQLAKAGFPEMAAQSDKLLKIAVASAKVSGELDNVDTIFNKLVKGIIRGSPRLIDDADIILKLGDANEKYAASLGKTVQELTAAEKVQATWNATLPEGERIIEMAEGVDIASDSFQGLKTATKETIDTIKAFVAMRLDDHLESIGISGFSAGEGILFSLSALAAMGEIMTDIALGGFSGGFQDLFGNMGADLEELSAQFISGSITFDEYKRRAFAVISPMDEIAERAFQIRREFLGLPEPIEAADQALMNLVDNWQDAQEPGVFDLSPINNAIAEMRLKVLDVGLAFIDVQEDMAEAERAFGEKMVDLRSDMSEKMRDITADLAEKQLDIAENYSEKIADIEQDLADKRNDIQEDLAEKLADISDDTQEKRMEQYRKHAEKIENIEEDHQKRINEIMRQFEMSRTKALISRDALALFEAERRRDEDLRKAKESAEEKRQTESEEFRKTTEELGREEEKRRRQAQEEVEKRRRDAEKAAERARRDAQDAREQQLEDAAEAAEKARAEAIKNYAEEQKEAIENYAQQKEDFAKWNEDRLREQKEAALNRRLQELMDQEEEYGRTKAWFDDLKQLYEDFNAFTEKNTPTYPSPGDDGTTPGGGTEPTTPPDDGIAPGPTSDGTDNITSGAYCNVASGVAYTGQDGQQYLCVNRVWTLVSEVFPDGGNATASGGGGAPGGINTASGVVGNGQQQVTIQVHGDDTLERIFSELAYDAIIEVVGA